MSSTDILPLPSGREPVPASTLERAVEELARGAVVGLPTETVYGLAVRADRLEAVEALRRLKGSDPARPFTWHVAERGAAHGSLSGFRQLGPLTGRLVERYWPGPLTLVLYGVPPGLEHVAQEGWTALRLPAHEGTREVLRAAPFPVVATSANEAGAPPATTASEVLAAFADRVPLVLDGGRAMLGEASAVLRLGPGRFELLRPGLLEADELRRAAGLSILFVCTGNTCRSPMAETLARSILGARLGLELRGRPSLDDPRLAAFGFRLASAGVQAGRGACASPEAVQVMAEAGLDLSEHRSAPALADAVRAAQRVYCMTSAHRQALLGLLPPGAAAHVELLDPEGRDVPDPIGGGYEDYLACAFALRAALEERAAEWA